MATKKGGLGRGLDALFADNATPESQGAPTLLSISDIAPNKEQPRKVFDQTELAALADSIAEHGLLQPILVRPLPNGAYQIVAGERRWRASRMAGLTQVPVQIKELSDQEADAIALIENLQRQDLNPVEEAKGYAALMEKHGLTQEAAAKQVGKSRSAVANALRLLTLPQAVLGMLEKGECSVGHAKVLLSAPKEQMLSLAVSAVEEGWSVRRLEAEVKAAKATPKAPKQPKAAFGQNPYLAQVQAQLTQQMGRKVKVTPTKGEKGKLEIEFYNQEELTQLAKLIGQFNE